MAKAEYAAFIHIKHRCFNPKHKQFKDYGGRGITLHSPWIDDFWAFYDHVGPRPGPEYSIDRIDNDLGYVPGNLRWATRKEQQNNQRRTVWITCPRTGVTRTMTDWAESIGITTMGLDGRMKRLGWSIEAALYSPRVNNRRPGRFMITIDGVEQRVTDTARARGIPVQTVYARLYRGLSPEDALKPVTRRR